MIKVKPVCKETRNSTHINNTKRDKGVVGYHLSIHYIQIYMVIVSVYCTPSRPSTAASNLPS